jgi:predicted ABC-type ATPase
MIRQSSKAPRCIVIAGPEWRGQNHVCPGVFAEDAGIIHFVNADLIAGGLSPLRPELAAIASGRIFLAELDRLAGARVDFAFETTLSGLWAGLPAASQTLENLEVPD